MPPHANRPEILTDPVMLVAGLDLGINPAIRRRREERPRSARLVSGGRRPRISEWNTAKIAAIASRTVSSLRRGEALLLIPCSTTKLRCSGSTTALLTAPGNGPNDLPSY